MMQQTNTAAAVGLRVLCSNGPQAVMPQLIPQFEGANGCAVSVIYDSGMGAMARTARGETADLYIFNAATIDELVKQNRIVRASRRDLVCCGIGIGALAGAPRPDIGTVEAFRRALLQAGSIAYADAGLSGIHFAGVIERLGIAAEVKAKARTQADGLVGKRVVNGEAELAVQFMSELKAVPGIDIVGPLPGELQKINTIVAGMGAASQQPVLAQALLDFLGGPVAAQIFEASGYDMCVPGPG